MPYKIIEQRREYNKKYYKEYSRKNREKLNAWNRNWRKNNPKYLADNRKRLKEDRQKYPERFKEYSRKQGIKTRQNVKERLLKLRQAMGGKCSRCGYNEYIQILHFHHLKDKVKEVTRMMKEEHMKIEAQKCTLLCPNCHAIITQKLDVL